MPATTLALLGGANILRIGVVRGYGWDVVSFVRQATVQDARGIAEVHVRAWQAAYRGLVCDEKLAGLSVDGRADRWTGLLARREASGFTLVAEEDGEVVGFCSIVAPARDEDLGPRACEIAAIYVAPKCWRSGLGGALLGQALTRLVDSRWDQAILWVFEDNPRARNFYAKHGFLPDGALKRATDDDPPEVPAQACAAQRKRRRPIGSVMPRRTPREPTAGQQPGRGSVTGTWARGPS